MTLEPGVITLHILRYDPDQDIAPQFQTYEIETTSSMNLLSALRYIFEHTDPTLAFRDYECHMGTCSSCRMQLNGKNVRACSALLEPGCEVRVEPAKGAQVIRDVVVDFESPAFHPDD